MDKDVTKKKTVTQPRVKTKAKAPSAVKIKPEREARSAMLLSKVPAECVFWCNDGSVFSDLRELAAGLAAMSDDTYAYHCNSERQDFTNWVRDIIRDEILADDLARAMNRKQAARFVVSRIALLTRSS